MTYLTIEEVKINPRTGLIEPKESGDEHLQEQNPSLYTPELQQTYLDKLANR